MSCQGVAYNSFFIERTTCIKAVYRAPLIRHITSSYHSLYDTFDHSLISNNFSGYPLASFDSSYICFIENGVQVVIYDINKHKRILEFEYEGMEYFSDLHWFKNNSLIICENDHFNNWLHINLRGEILFAPSKSENGILSIDRDKLLYTDSYNLKMHFQNGESVQMNKVNEPIYLIEEFPNKEGCLFQSYNYFKDKNINNKLFKFNYESNTIDTLLIFVKGNIGLFNNTIYDKHYEWHDNKIKILSKHKDISKIINEKYFVLQ